MYIEKEDIKIKINGSLKIKKESQIYQDINGKIIKDSIFQGNTIFIIETHAEFLNCLTIGETYRLLLDEYFLDINQNIMEVYKPSLECILIDISYDKNINSMKFLALNNSNNL